MTTAFPRQVWSNNYKLEFMKKLQTFSRSEELKSRKTKITILMVIQNSFYYATLFSTNLTNAKKIIIVHLSGFLIFAM